MVITLTREIMFLCACGAEVLPSEFDPEHGEIKLRPCERCKAIAERDCLKGALQIAETFSKDLSIRLNEALSGGQF